MSLADLAYIRPEANFVPVLCGWKKVELHIWWIPLIAGLRLASIADLPGFIFNH